MNTESPILQGDELCQALLNALFLDSHARFLAADADFKIRAVSPGAAKLLGYVWQKETFPTLQDLFNDGTGWKELLSLIKKRDSVSGHHCRLRGNRKELVDVILDIKALRTTCARAPAAGPAGLFSARGGSAACLAEAGETPAPQRVLGGVQGYLIHIGVNAPAPEMDSGQVQKVLMRMNRLASIGQITAAFVHGIKTPLHVISSMSELMLENKLEPQIREGIQMIARNAQKTYQTVQTVLAYSKDVNTHLEKVALHPVVQSICDLLSGNFNARQVELICTLNPMSDVMADANQIREAVCNILINSLDATVSGGQVTIIAGMDDRKKSAYIEVKDTGAGIPEDVLPRICEPFFSTKEKGTGLGLYLADQIMKGHGGNFAIESRKGVGTTVTLSFPCSIDGQ
ncbi:MAG: hypothetical protein A2021_04685 [Elusimicrobia bacterium GWF2_52_66]|nr:MAG: hypothetical protein A2X33_03410 [Elusimicrobia bacterium GWA2_51_34]OGR87442.1 MAG: hypothetical protein A2021_04685 [Elusimicrobia bacterium GWF2_52_66]HAF95609.1 hypothetical protein [Elusimicrobiota bacterium]HCE98299.1 hypothetical protein [Elusimicrobiota bacterium]